MKILITAPGEYVSQSTDQPIVGRYYELEDVQQGTGAQNRAFHALVGEYYKSGCHSYDQVSFNQFRDCIKRDLGAGFEKVMYSQTPLFVVKSISDVPDEIRRADDYKAKVMGKLKSWTDYGKKERRNTMDMLIAEMHQTGVSTKKFHEILEGMEKIW